MLQTMPAPQAPELPEPVLLNSLNAIDRQPGDVRLGSTATPHWADALWRALLYCLFPRIVALSVLPLVLAGGLLGLLAWFSWEPAVSAVRLFLEQGTWGQTVFAAFDRFGLGGLRALMAPVLVVILAVPVVLVACLLLVASFMTPAMVKLVQSRRLPALRSRAQTPWWRSLSWSVWSTLLAVIAFVVTLPLWLLPPFPLLLPPLVWGWLTYRVMAFDTLADWATPTEMRQLLQSHRKSLLWMGVASGLLGAAPSALWAMGALALAFAPFILLLSIWLYTLAFALASLWFAHFLLPALMQLRDQQGEPLAAQQGTTS